MKGEGRRERKREGSKVTIPSYCGAVNDSGLALFPD